MVAQDKQDRAAKNQPAQRGKRKPTVATQQPTQGTSAGQTTDDSVAPDVTPQKMVKEQVAAKKVIKAEIDESRTFKHVFKSNPDLQIKEFIKKASKPNQAAAKPQKTPADAHPPSVAQELLETDDDVADNLGKLFKASKSYKKS